MCKGNKLNLAFSFLFVEFLYYTLHYLPGNRLWYYFQTGRDTLATSLHLPGVSHRWANAPTLIPPYWKFSYRISPFFWLQCLWWVSTPIAVLDHICVMCISSWVHDGLLSATRAASPLFSEFRSQMPFTPCCLLSTHHKFSGLNFSLRISLYSNL